MFKKFKAEHSLSEYEFNANMFPVVSDRDFWDGFADKEYVKLAQEAIDYAWPTIKATDYMEFIKTGKRAMEPTHNERRSYLMLFFYAELAENKGRFLPQIVNGLLAICEETSWCASAHWADEIPKNLPNITAPYIDLLAAETSEHLVSIITLLREPLMDFCPEIIERVEYELEYRIKSVYLAHKDYWWMGYGTRIPNNWNPWIISNLMTVFLVTEKDRTRLEASLNKMFDELQYYYDGMPDDGGCDEGPGYWGRAGASLFECVYQIKKATGGKLNLFNDEKLGKIGAFLKTVHVAKDYFVSVADSHYSPNAFSMIITYAFGKETGQRELMNFAAAVYRERTTNVDPYHHTNSNLRRMLYYHDFFDELKAYEPTYPVHTGVEILPDVELAGIRCEDKLVFAKGGHNDESHNHNDVGSFTFYDGLDPILADVGIGIYTRFTFSEHRYTMIPWVKAENHTIPAFNGVGQQYGVQYRADSFAATDDKIEISFASAYPSEAGVLDVKRVLTVNEKGMKCVDSFKFADDTKKQTREVFVCVLPVRIEDNCAIINESFRLSASAGKLSSEFVPFEDLSLERSWKKDGMTRILFDADGVDEIEICVERI